MGTLILKVVAMFAVVVAIKKKTDLAIIRLTNLKTYATVEAIIIGMAN